MTGLVVPEVLEQVLLKVEPLGKLPDTHATLEWVAGVLFPARRKVQKMLPRLLEIRQLLQFVLQFKMFALWSHSIT